MGVLRIKYTYGVMIMKYDYSDPRVEQYPFLGSPFPLIFLVAVYLHFVLKWGPKWMDNRKPYDLTWPINVYNFVQVVVNLCLGVFVSFDI